MRTDLERGVSLLEAGLLKGVDRYAALAAISLKRIADLLEAMHAPTPPPTPAPGGEEENAL